jgi:predicted DNA-binding transcriptional regulator YafY
MYSILNKGDINCHKNILEVKNMRADRLISILLLLQNKGKMTTNALAQELEVTPRTIHRDMEALSAAGIPILAERGKTGGWRLMDQYKTNLTGLKQNEIKSLFFSPSLELLGDLGLTQEWQEARQKLLASLPSSMNQHSFDTWNRIYADTSTWKDAPRNVHESLEVLQKAIWQEKQLIIDYRKADGSSGKRTVEPLGLVAKRNSWYLIALSNGEYRNFKVSRIISATFGREGFTRPEDFNLADYWTASKRQFVSNLPSFEVCAEAHPNVVNRLNFTGRFVQSISLNHPVSDGWVTANLCFDTEEEAAAFLLGFGGRVRVVSPDYLNKVIYELAKEVVEKFEGK